MGNEAIILFTVIGIVLVGGGMIATHFLAPKSNNSIKEDIYECGVPTQGLSWIQFKVGYYLFAILFLIFDVETVFIYPWAVMMKKIGLAAFIEILIFFFILGFGLLYAWKKGALKWE